jgi:serine/threonine protein phosphatase PrpC
MEKMIVYFDISLAGNVKTSGVLSDNWFFIGGALEMKENEVSFNTGFLAEAGSKSKFKGYYGAVEMAGLGCWIIAERVDTIENKDSAKIAVEGIITRFKRTPTISKVKIKEYLLEAHQKLRNESKFEMLKACLIMVVTDYAKVVWAVVGNVRLYHFREGQFNFRSKDQTIAQLMVDSGLMDEDEVNNREERNSLINNLGGISECKPFISEPFNLQDGDVLLLCNSGLWEKMKNQEIAAVLGQVETPQELITKLKAAVLAKGGFNLKNYTLGAIFAQKVVADNNRLDFRKITSGIINKAAMRFAKLIVKKITGQLTRPASQVTGPEATPTIKHHNVHACTTARNSECKLPDGNFHPNTSEKLPPFPIGKTEAKTFVPVNSNLQLSSIGVTESEAAITDEPFSPVLRVVKPEGGKTGQPGKNWLQTIQRITGLILTVRLPQILQRIGGAALQNITKSTAALVKKTSRQIHYVGANLKVINILGLLILLVVCFGWLFNHRMGELKIQKEIEAGKQIQFSRQQTLTDHEQIGDQLANDEQYPAALMKYRLALANAHALNDQGRIVALTKKIAITNSIITGDELIAVGNYQAALNDYLQANTNAVGINCLRYGVNKKIAWTQQMMELLSLEQVGDQEMGCRNYAAARVVYQSAQNIASRIGNGEIAAVLAAKLDEVNRKIAQQAKTSPIIVTRQRNLK